MPGIEAMISFAVALFFIEITPGLDMMFAISRWIGQGRRNAVLSMKVIKKQAL